MVQSSNHPITQSLNRYYLLFSVFISGMTVLAVEVSASRLLGPVFGDSHPVWASIIGLMLLYLSAGYFIGGRWADRSPSPRTFFQILAWGAFLCGGVPLIARPVLQWAAGFVASFDAAVAIGSFGAVLVLFAVPITLLGCASPFAIRLALTSAEQAVHAGQISGQIYAVSTFGSILGSFLPVLWLIPTLGTTPTFLLFSGLLLIVALIGLWQADKRQALFLLWMPLGLMAGAWFTSSGFIKPSAGLLYERESEYNFIQVVEREGIRLLLLNEGQGIHSVYAPGLVETQGTWDFFLAAPYFNATPRSPDSLAVVGLAAGTIPKQYTQVYGAIPIDGIEIDAAIVEVGRRYFDMTEPNLNVIIADGRWALAHLDKQYSVIGVDAYRLPYIPWHLTTREFFQSVHDHLQSDGVLVINVGRTARDRRLIAAMTATLRSVFPAVYVVDVPNTLNSIVFATMQPTQADNLRRNAGQLPASTHPVLHSVLTRAVANLQATPTDDSILFTDERAPLEQITNSIVLDFVLGLR